MTKNDFTLMNTNLTASKLSMNGRKITSAIYEGDIFDQDVSVEVFNMNIRMMDLVNPTTLQDLQDAYPGPITVQVDGTYLT